MEGTAKGKVGPPVLSAAANTEKPSKNGQNGQSGAMEQKQGGEGEVASNESCA